MEPTNKVEVNFDNNPFKIVKNCRKNQEKKEKTRKHSLSIKPKKIKKQRKMTMNNINAQQQEIQEEVQEPMKINNFQKDKYQNIVDIFLDLDHQKHQYSGMDQDLQKGIPFNCKEDQLDYQSPFDISQHNNPESFMDEEAGSQQNRNQLMKDQNKY